jgi:FMN phosphatase YigB (HAD superfamily)
VLPFLRRVHEQGDVVLGVITHGLEYKQAEKLLLLKVVPYLNPAAIFISDQVGISKPNPKLYQRACAALGSIRARSCTWATTRCTTWTRSTPWA